MSTEGRGSSPWSRGEMEVGRVKMRHLSGRRKDGGMELRGPLCRWRAPGGVSQLHAQVQAEGATFEPSFSFKCAQKHKNV